MRSLSKITAGDERDAGYFAIFREVTDALMVLDGVSAGRVRT
jgi:hypothetical protein